MKIKHKKFISIGLLVVILVAGMALWKFIIDNNQDNEYGPKPTDNFVDSYYSGERGHECSKKIKGEWVKGTAGPLAAPEWEFRPDSQEEANKYCRPTWVIEYRAVIDILKREDVSRIIDKYDSVNASVRALGHTYIEDKEYLERILPTYNNMAIDCIIVVHSPEGTRFFLENGDVHDSHDDHKYTEIPSEEFLASLNNAPDEDVTAFWLGLH